MLINPFLGYLGDIGSVDTILDIGSRDLQQSQEFASVYPDARVYAFECHPEFIDTCKASLGGRIELVSKAVMDHVGTTSFFEVKPALNGGASSVYKQTTTILNRPIPEAKEITVPCTRIDTWAKNIGIDHIDLVWMDVQGAELPAFKGFGALLQTVKAIATEAELRPIYKGATQMPELMIYLREQGFTLVKIDQAWEKEADLIFLRNDLC